MPPKREDIWSTEDIVSNTVTQMLICDIGEVTLETSVKLETAFLTGKKELEHRKIA